MTERGLPDILKRILRTKAQEVVAAAQARPLREVSRDAERAPAPRGFRAALCERIAAGEPAVIAEIKKASPSKGVLRAEFDPAGLARDYEAGGAAALSVLTDREFFQGAPEHLRDARAAVSVPALRKDFIVDQYQIYEARALGADAVLLIVGALGDAQLVEFSGLAQHLGMDTVVEVHDEVEMERALALAPPVLGINNRDLRTFETNLETSLRLRSLAPPEQLLITESGIHTAQDVARIRACGIHGFLVGEAFMRAAHPGQRLRALFGSGPADGAQRTP